MIKLILLFILLINFGCENKKNIKEEFVFTSKMIDSTILACKKNGGVKFIELGNNSGYFQCEKQGYLKVDSLGKLSNVIDKKEKTKVINKIDLNKCFLKCDEKKLQIKLNGDDFFCFCN